MFTKADVNNIKKRGSDINVVENQIENFKTGFPFLTLDRAATPSDGILVLNQKEVEQLVKDYEQKTAKLNIVKFVPASGAASRMFKLLYSFLEICVDPQRARQELDKSGDLQSIGTFFGRIRDFAFYDDLDSTLRQQGKSVQTCIRENDFASVLNALLESPGLDYGNLPKGLLKFHRYENDIRTPVMEHLSEGALYAQSKNNMVNIHFTVSPEHKEKFKLHIVQEVQKFQKIYNAKYLISFSEQKAHTDTIAVDLDNEPFRNPDGSLLFRPAGHGALLANLNDIDADIVFIKNIDNVVPDNLKADTIAYKKAIGALLLKYQEKIFGFLKLLEAGVSHEQLEEIMNFVSAELMIGHLPKIEDREQTIKFLKNKLNRPIRICGMVKNEGEPGGGPFYAVNQDGTVSLQIVESSQIDFSDSGQKKIALEATHFNPVDLVCGVKNYKGEKFDLNTFVDPQTGFISQKSKDGKELKAQELPGLWNGSMSDWNTIFFEVPISTFNPVKTVNDLLRPQHQ